ncbi:polyprotein of retroviral origin, putative [Trichonephila clavipes]|nr:polyprotein of retroviral origin, putative [Trichonephila clavipes]
MPNELGPDRTRDLSPASTLKKIDSWIFESQMQVKSDHNPLTYLTKGLPHGTKLARWALVLQRYELQIIYRTGPNHGNADASLASF